MLGESRDKNLVWAKPGFHIVSAVLSLIIIDLYVKYETLLTLDKDNPLATSFHLTTLPFDSTLVLLPAFVFLFNLLSMPVCLYRNSDFEEPGGGAKAVQNLWFGAGREFAFLCRDALLAVAWLAITAVLFWHGRYTGVLAMALGIFALLLDDSFRCDGGYLSRKHFARADAFPTVRCFFLYVALAFVTIAFLGGYIDLCLSNAVTFALEWLE